MNTRLEENNTKISLKLKIFYAVIILICIIAIIVAVYVQIKSDKKETTGAGNTTANQPATNMEANKKEFNNMFDNQVNYMNNNNYKITKIEQSKEIIYTGYQKKENVLNDYELDINIPYINIHNEKIEEYNKEIVETFEKKAKSILNIQNNSIIYTVNYSAYVTNNILSLVIRSTLKEGNNPQRDIVQTYNYDLTNQKEYTIQEVLEMRGITKQQANQKIKEEIKQVQQNVSQMQNLGYKVYPRNAEDDMYNVNNVTEFFLGENNKLYIVFAYGNKNNTSEIDIIVM